MFHPTRAVHTDGVDPSNRVLTCSITEIVLPSSPSAPSGTSCSPPSSSLSSGLSCARPAATRVFRLHRPKDRRWLAEWLRWADVILGWNLQYDVLFLRSYPEFRPALTSQLLVDGQHLNYLYNETTTERSLKTIGPALRTHSYSDESLLLKQGTRYRSPDDPRLLHYNAEDSHNTALAIAELCRLLHRDYPTSPKHSDRTVAFYSDLTWSFIRMSESGYCMSVPALEALEIRLTAESESHFNACRDLGLLLSGEGSNKSKSDFLNRCIALTGAANDRRLTFTEKTRALSTSEENRRILLTLLPSDSPEAQALRWWNAHSAAQKLISSYTFPLLRHSRSDPSNRKSILIPQETPWTSSQSTSGTSSASPSPTASPSSPSATSPTSSPSSSPEAPTPTSDSPPPANSPRSSTTSSTRPRSTSRAIAYPTWYLTPSPVKDGAGDSGGQQQCRPSAKHPNLQTFPPAIKHCATSRFGG